MGFLIKMTVKIFYLFNVRLANIKSRILVRNFNSALLFLYPAAMFLFKISNLKRARAEFFKKVKKCLKNMGNLNCREIAF